jgi:hypothetical protein
MAAQEHYITQADFDQRIGDFTGHLNHTINMAKAELRREIVMSAEQIKVELRTEIQAVKTELSERIDQVEQRLDRVENMGKLNHQMLQLVLEQLSKISKKLGTD